VQDVGKEQTISFGCPSNRLPVPTGWRRLGADMVMLYPMYRITNVDDHIETLPRFKGVASG
jgi:hypothetical protein